MGQLDGERGADRVGALFPLTFQFSIVSGVLPSSISFIFGYFLPIVIRSISKYQGGSAMVSDASQRSC